MRQDVAIQPDAILAGADLHAHQTFVATLLPNAPQIVVE
jgi:hypothetical protein